MGTKSDLRSADGLVAGALATAAAATAATATAATAPATLVAAALGAAVGVQLHPVVLPVEEGIEGRV